ncbi:CDP-glycerol glycerophosphotransferase family protein [Micromonospora sp. M51]|uniref:CDP-glycerol glycerophosphotransferase family protein n=1 Tax=Micromonospora parva TaxID=1464048 RepID=A0ABW6VY11_9ACTN|nr:MULTISPECIES: CDP-glycerol glycerophosphotransferase family protein [Micromonospora]MBQ1010336.1 CDP-glycerol glycerophosphotransferase family protein [Micromonospora sp. M51]MBQ1030874.1 CDP-glycerol glycerophosphotransferase family protein [Micromonospora sp. C97]
MFGTLTGRLGVAAQSALLVLAYLVMLVAGVFGWVGLFAVAGLAAIIGEFAVARWSPPSQLLLEKVGLHWSYRQLTRDLAAVLLVAAEVRLSGGELTLLLVLPAAVWVVSVFAGAFSTMIERRNPISAMVRNIELGPLSSAPTPPAWAAAVAGDRMPLLNLLLVPAGVAAAVQHDPTPFFVAGAVAVVATGLVGAIIALTWLRGRGAGQGPLLPAVQRWLDNYRPEVALYFAGPAKDVYQANMWLAPTEALQQRAVVLMRSREAFLELADTRLPVICVPAGVDFMNLDLGGVRAALYAANVGANIHMLREPGTKHVFVGHGDSDKQASVNPYSKVYDEVWVAGLAGRERYARAGVGVLDSDIVEIGRPQLAGVHTFGAESVDRPFTVLYAPTWEGWLDDDPYHTSLVLMGERIVKGLLATNPRLRLIYKPHPLTGSRSKAARAVHERIVAAIRAAGGDADASSLDGTAHLVVTGRTPALFDCFNQTDLLISDVSSVVSDFVQSQRPYVVANPAGLSEDDFRREYPTARAAYLLSKDCGELEKIVTVTRAGDDPMTEARRELKTYLLGPAEANPMDRFQQEIDRLCH